jgi:hypothetical protein
MALAQEIRKRILETDSGAGARIRALLPGAAASKPAESARITKKPHAPDAHLL